MLQTIMVTKETKPTKNIHKAWLMLIAVCCIHLGTFGILLNTLSVFTVPVCSDLGIGRGDFSMQNTLRSLFTCAALPLTTIAYKRVNIRVLTTFCGALSIFTVASMSFYNEAWQWNISGAILGVAGSVCVNTMNQTITGNWFNKKAGLAVGIAASFSGVGGTFFTPIVASIMEKVGWRITYLIIAAFCALLVFPFSIFVIRYKPSDLGLKPYGWNDKDSQLIEKPVVKSQNMTTLGIRKLPILVLGIGAGFVALSSTFYQHAPAYASSIGYSLMVGSIVYSVLFFGNILGKLGFGYLVDRFGVKKIGPAPIIVSMSGLLSILLVGKSSQFLLMCASFLFGTIYCFVNIIVSMTVRISYGNERFTTIFPLVSLISTLIGSTGSIIIGYLYDYFGSYFVAILACIGFYILALLLFCVFLGMKKQSQIRIYPTTP